MTLRVYSLSQCSDFRLRYKRNSLFRRKNVIGRKGSEHPTRSSGFKTWIITSKFLPLPFNNTRVVTFFLESSSCSGMKVPAATAKGFRAHISGHKVVLDHSSRSAQQACQPMGHAGGSVAGSLLGSDADLQDGERRQVLSVRGKRQGLAPWGLHKENCSSLTYHLRIMVSPKCNYQSC